METERSCDRVRRHRFRCSIEEPTCLSVTAVGNQYDDCHNRFDELWLGANRKLSDMRCNVQSNGECSLLREYIDRSWTLTNGIETSSQLRIAFHFYCDRFWNVESREEEDLVECRQWWVCPEDQWQCKTGQFIDKDWRRDNDWDCGDASDEHHQLNLTTQQILHPVPIHGSDVQGYAMPKTCNQTRPFLCPSPRASPERFSCIDLTQIGDNQIDCAGAIDEHNTLTHCTSQSSMLGYNFRCLTTNTCIPYWLHYWENNRCPNRSDDEHWCYRHNLTSEEISPADVRCFDGQISRNGRCDGYFGCRYGEDEYMCDYLSLFRWTTVPYREWKESRTKSAQHVLRLHHFPTEANITLSKRVSDSTTKPREEIHYNKSASSLSPYWCNRGLGVLLSNGSIVCFCPAQYFGDKCQNQTDRLSVLLSLDLSQSIYQPDSDPAIILKVFVLFSFNNQTLMTHEADVRPGLERTSRHKTKDRKKMSTHFLYPQSLASRQNRLERLNNRSNLINIHPYSIRIEIYATRRLKQPPLIAIWQYPIEFDYLPVVRLAKVLCLTGSSDHPNSCLSSPCRHDREECHPLINDRVNYICLCKPNFTGENSSQVDARCGNGYCASGSVCKPNYRGDDLPLCLCSSGRYGDRCDLEHDGCLSKPCFNDGSCFPGSQPDEVVCACAKEYFGSTCQWKRAHLQLSIVDSSSHEGAVVQYLQINFTSLHLILVYRQTGPQLPDWIHFDNDQRNLPEIVLAKLYSSHKDSSPELYLLSSHQNAISVEGTTEISEINRCPHVRTFDNGNPYLSLDILQNDLVYHSI